MEKMMINPDYAKPILALANLCTKEKIPHTINTIHDGLQIRFPWNHGDFVCHFFSYGHEYGDVESMGCPWDNHNDDDVSRLTVEDAIMNLVSWYREYKIENCIINF